MIFSSRLDGPYRQEAGRPTAGLHRRVWGPVIPSLQLRLMSE